LFIQKDFSVIEIYFGVGIFCQELQSCNAISFSDKMYQIGHLKNGEWFQNKESVIVQIAHKIKIAVDLRKGIVGRNILV
jgi:adenine-specific DNA methylase